MEQSRSKSRSKSRSPSPQPVAAGASSPWIVQQTLWPTVLPVIPSTIWCGILCGLESAVACDGQYPSNNGSNGWEQIGKPTVPPTDYYGWGSLR
ncbi:unnamed protein product [Rotaria sordida]|uniref:Uncharacterized protein n=1 Tax=Rotaria sordida TaxID=392033 RepID=A0A815IQH2_9BILA